LVFEKVTAVCIMTERAVQSFDSSADLEGMAGDIDRFCAVVDGWGEPYQLTAPICDPGKNSRLLWPPEVEP
jgi:hypothetical protein